LPDRVIGSIKRQDLKEFFESFRRLAFLQEFFAALNSPSDFLPVRPFWSFSHGKLFTPDRTIGRSRTSGCGVVHSKILGGVRGVENAVTGNRNYEGHTGAIELGRSLLR
jgi:hypothetical protein